MPFERHMITQVILTTFGSCGLTEGSETTLPGRYDGTVKYDIHFREDMSCKITEPNINVASYFR